jgi:Fur family transcriptional regulator, ferric uptake regulator
MGYIDIETQSQYAARCLMQTAEEKKFREFLKGEGLKFTSERRRILEEVFRIHEHFEVDDIVIGLRGRGERVSRASVYRTMPLLVGSGLLRQVHSAEKHSHYEHIFGHDHHDHLICRECGRAIEFSNQEIEELQARVCGRHGFLPATHRLEIFGTCSKCRRKGGR